LIHASTHQSHYSVDYRLWNDLTEAITLKDMEKATTAKTSVEDAQREQRKQREESGEVFVPRFFENVNGRWVPKLKYVSLLYMGHFVTQRNI
jgi:hypothetical protein